MTDATPEIGDIVLYRLRVDQAEAINRRRQDARSNYERHQHDKNGFILHVGNEAHEGDIVPLVVIKIWSEVNGCLKGQAFLDGNDLYWVTSAVRGEMPGEWHWPAR